MKLPESLGFRSGTSSVHMSRTMMLGELSLVLEHVEPKARADEYVAATERLIDRLLTEAGGRPGRSLDDWLRDSFFDQHCKRFHNRPFLWHIWDGRKDGFSCVVNYHKLDHKALENLTYSYLGDWSTAQSKSDKVGADLRLAAAQALQEKLKLILAGEPPYASSGAGSPSTSWPSAGTPT